jgi:hypothetical protein
MANVNLLDKVVVTTQSDIIFSGNSWIYCFFFVRAKEEKLLLFEFIGCLSRKNIERNQKNK